MSIVDDVKELFGFHAEKLNQNLSLVNDRLGVIAENGRLAEVTKVRQRWGGEIPASGTALLEIVIPLGEDWILRSSVFASSSAGFTAQLIQGQLTDITALNVSNVVLFQAPAIKAASNPLSEILLPEGQVFTIAFTGTANAQWGFNGNFDKIKEIPEREAETGSGG